MEAVAHRGHVVTVLNLKGGVGKTHACWLLAAVCQEQGHRLLAVDLDPQGNLTSSLLLAADDRPTAEILFDPAADADARGLVRGTAFDHIDLIPSAPAIARYDLSDQRQWEQADLHLTLLEPVARLRPEYDYVVFDCPPRLSLVSFAALCASDFVVIPLEAADWGAQGVVQVTAAIEYVRRHFNPDLHLLGYLVSRFKKARAYQQSYLAELRRHFGSQAFDTVVPDMASFEQSVIDRVPVTLRPRSGRAAAIARELFAEVERRIAEHVGTNGGSPDLRRVASAPPGDARAA
jgi:chromosome partitioning protein